MLEETILNIGFVKAPRNIINKSWYKDIKTRALYFHLLLRVNYVEKVWNGVLVKAGEIITSRSNLAKENNLSEQELRTALNKLKQAKDIEILATFNYSKITLLEWESYEKNQPSNQPSKQPSKQEEINQVINQANNQVNIGLKDNSNTQFQEQEEKNQPSNQPSKQPSILKKSTNNLTNKLTTTKEIKEVKEIYIGEKNKNIVSFPLEEKQKNLSNSFNPDLAFNKNVNQVFELYEKLCPDLIKLKFEKRNKERLQQVKDLLELCQYDFEYIKELFAKANEQIVFYDEKICFQSLIKNHEKIYQGLGKKTNTQQNKKGGAKEVNNARSYNPYM